jgi:hypothetical protein
LLPTENLDEIFTWQETRQVSQSLTFNYQRQLFLLEDTPETRPLAGKRVVVSELNDGTVQVRHDGKVLAMTIFSKEEARITQGAMVSNKLLSGVLQHIKDKQAKKDSDKVVKLRTKRDKRLLLLRLPGTTSQSTRESAFVSGRPIASGIWRPSAWQGRPSLAARPTRRLDRRTWL